MVSLASFYFVPKDKCHSFREVATYILGYNISDLSAWISLVAQTRLINSFYWLKQTLIQNVHNC